MGKDFKLDSDSILNPSRPDEFIAGALILIMSALILTQMFPFMVNSSVAIGTLSNFTFNSLFQANGVFIILLSILGLVTIFSIMGVRSSPKR